MTKLAHAGTAAATSVPYKCDADFFWRDLLRAMFPDNTAAYTASFTQTSVGAAEHVLRGRNGLSGRALINLLRSPIGPKVLDAITDGAEWRACERRLIDIYELQNQLQNIEQKRRALERALVGPR